MSKRIVIVGGGFGGLSAFLGVSRRLHSKDKTEVVLIDKLPYTTYTPLLYEVASGSICGEDRQKELKAGLAVPFSLTNLPYPTDVEIVNATVESVDTLGRNIRLSSGKSMRYSALILACGSQLASYGVPGVKEYAVGLKTLSGALKIRSRITALLKEGRAGLRDSVNVVVIGGGANGVETAAELAGAFKKAKSKKCLNVPWSILVVDSCPRLLSQACEAVSALVVKRLRRLSVDVSVATDVREIGDGWMSVSPNAKLKGKGSIFRTNKKHPADLIIWAGGTAARPEWKKWGFETDDRGYVKVTNTLQVKGKKTVWAIGDMIALDKPFPRQAPVAIAEGEVVAENVIRYLRGEVPNKKVRTKNWPFIVPLGGKYAVCSFKGKTFAGLTAFVFRRLVDLRYLFSILSVPRALSVWYKGGRVYSENDFK